MAEVDYEARRQAWVEAFGKARAQMPAIGKGSTVDTGTYRYTYAALPDILEAVMPALAEHGLVLSQSVEGDTDRIEVWTRIYHAAGHVETFGPLVLGVRGDAKATGSAITYARRYALTAALGIAPDEDDDASAASRSQAQAPAVRTEPTEQTPWQWVWIESAALFPHWTSDQRLKAAEVALEGLAYDAEPADRDQAEAVLTHMRGQYAEAEYE